MISRVKGTRDVLDLRTFNFVVELFRAHMATYHFEEIETPLIEHLELFQRSLGTHTDVVGKEMFLVQGMGSSEQLCLRPEATAPATRAFLENGIQDKPWQVFSVGPMFRHERPQKGRYRQFHQMNVEVINTDAATRDVDAITMLDRFFHERLQLSNYALTLNFLGCFDDRKAYREVLKQFLASASMCETCQVRREQNTLRVFDCKNPQCQEQLKSAPTVLEHLCGTCEKEWAQIQEYLGLCSVSFAIKPTLVRGLDYYNRVVFEFVSDNLGAQNAFCGGGRYELAQQLGSKNPVPSFGAAIGIERVMMLIEASGMPLKVPEKPAVQVVAPLSEQQHMVALLLADTMRAAGVVTEVLLEGGSLKSMMRTANRIGAMYVLMIGDDEQQAREVTMRHMMTGEQKRIAQVDVVAHIRRA